MQSLRYRVEAKKFEELILATFEENTPKFEPVLLRKGMA
jgi:hypothetical protein